MHNHHEHTGQNISQKPEPVAHCPLHEDYEASIMNEITHHLPYAIFSVAFGMIIATFFSFFSAGQAHEIHEKMDLLFHSFHFLHIIFAVTGAYIIYARFSPNRIMAAIVSLASALIFCPLSDIVLPYLAGTILGTQMELHLCLYSEFHNVGPFILIGLLNGMVLSRHASHTQSFYSVSSHFGHIFVSSLASLFYLIGHGCDHWYSQMGIIFVFMIIAVIFPCTMADIIVPMWCVRLSKKLRV